MGFQNKPFSFDFEKICKYISVGFINKLFKIKPSFPINKEAEIKIHTDYDNYIKIHPKQIYFEPGSLIP